MFFIFYFCDEGDPLSQSDGVYWVNSTPLRPSTLVDFGVIFKENRVMWRREVYKK